jgi:NAD+ kinase
LEARRRVKREPALFGKAIILSRLDHEDAVRLAGKLAAQLKKRKVKVWYESKLAERLGVRGVNPSEVEADLAVIVGGDGTVLRAVHILQCKIPLFTVSMGRVGFLGEAAPSEALGFLQEVLEGRYVEDKHFMVEADVRELPPALNEIKIGSGNPKHMVELSVYVDDFWLARDKVDGVLVSTPSGASAYAFSVGGNLIDPRLEALVIAPVYPLSANFKPYVVPSSVEVTVKPESEAPLLVVADGLKVRRLSPPRPVKVKRSKEYVVFLRRSFTFYDRIKRRLSVSCL